MKTQEIIDICDAELQSLQDGTIRPSDKLGSAADAFARIKAEMEKRDKCTVGERFMWARRYPRNDKGIPYDPISGKPITKI